MRALKHLTTFAGSTHGTRPSARVQLEARYPLTLTGKGGCECIDISSVLKSLLPRSCETDDGQEGVLLTVTGPCVPYSYGSGACLEHDMMYDPACSGDPTNLPDYCTAPWCYVDSGKCLHESSEMVYRSVYFPYDEGVNLFYSYTTCFSSQGEDWFASYRTIAKPLKGVNMLAAIPGYWEPFHYKRNPGGAILTAPGKEYYSLDVPWEGATLDYFRSLMSISGGDFNVTYVHGSRAAKNVHPESSFTAVVKDVENGIVDLGVGPFWVTGERLKMASFTVPVFYDRTVLVIPKPGKKLSLKEQVDKVAQPFSPGVWIVVILVIAFTALLSVWFSDTSKKDERPGKRVYARWALDSLIDKWVSFCGASVDRDHAASLPYKLLMCGFSFFVLIVVSSYVANLAAFLTRNLNDFEGTIEEVIASGKRICALPALKTALESKWDKAKFVYDTKGHSTYYAMLEDYDARRCDVLAIGNSEFAANVEIVNGMCARNLVATGSQFTENALAFPINPLFAAGISYWMYQGEKLHGITLLGSIEKYKKRHNLQPSCKIQGSAQELASDEYQQIELSNLFFPILFFLVFAVLAAIVQLYHQWIQGKGGTARQQRRQYLGRTSTVGTFISSRLFDYTADEADFTTGSEGHTSTHDNPGSSSRELSAEGNGGFVQSENALSRFQRFDETGALDELVAYFQDIKKLKES